MCRRLSIINLMKNTDDVINVRRENSFDIHLKYNNYEENEVLRNGYIWINYFHISKHIKAAMSLHFNQ